MTDWIPLSELTFEVINDRSNLADFLCSEQELTNFLKDDALSGQNERFSATRIVTYEDKLVGYFTLVNDSITVHALEETDRNPSYKYSKYPALKIARLATHIDFIERGIGTSMILKIYSALYKMTKYTGCRFITVDSKNNEKALKFYSNKGFKPAIMKPRDTIPMYIDYHRWVVEEEERLRTTLEDFNIT